MHVINVAGLDPKEFSEISNVVSTHTQLLDVLNCNEIDEVKRLSPEIVTQDEYTHDIIIEWGNSIYLVYDAN
ncbi:MAG: hypothetical protein KIT57_07955 [Blastocatellales bacterium]|nr:hypothetical protein [Blastocatellales bacterium]